MGELAVDRERAGGVVVILPRGRVDFATARRLEAVLGEVLAAGDAALVVDLAGVDYISSAGLRVILTAGKRAKARGGALVLASPGPTIREVLEIAGFLRLFRVADTRAEAVAAAS